MTSFSMELLNADSHIHFIGIGGISMSGLAEILIINGYKVSGSDLSESNITHKLKSLGVIFYKGHDKNNVIGADLVVYTAAVTDSNPEIRYAEELNILRIERPILLGEIMKKYKNAIAVSGTHGKTTTTSMISMILLHADTDPTILVGGELDAIGGNIRAGNSTYFLTEACEYHDSFLEFHPSVGIILNIEADHLDYFRDLDHIVESFTRFIARIPESGAVVVCADDANVLKSSQNAKCKIIKYGMQDDLYDWKAENIRTDNNGCSCFDVYHNREKVISDIQMAVPGIHNVYNALGASACSYYLGIKPDIIRDGLGMFKGTRRRFEVKGDMNGFTVIDDYAHHPTEIEATLTAASAIAHNKLWCIFQPHTYTRTRSLMDDFCKALTLADKVIVTDIYAAREPDTGKVHSREIAVKMQQSGYDSLYMSNFNEIAEYILKEAHPEDLIITMGAGNVYEIGDIILKHK